MAKPIRYIKVDGRKRPIYAEDESGNPICGRELSDGSICTAAAGDGTKHPGYGRCDAHDHGTGGKPGNTNKAEDGLVGAIWKGLLEPEVIEFWDNMRTDTLEQVNNEIKLCDAREYYLLKKIKELRESESKDNFVMVEQRKDDFKKIPADTIILNYYRSIDAVQARKSEILKIKARLEDSDPELGNIDNMLTLIEVLNVSKHKVEKVRGIRLNEIDED